MRSFDQLSPRQQVIRKNIFHIAFYSAFAFVLVWSISKMVEIQNERNAQYNRIEDTMMDFYRETREQGDTLGMSTYMRERLSLNDYKGWQRQGK